MELSIVSGTLNRLEHLKRMVASVRHSAGSLSYEIILVDGGSTDGTQDWARAQENVRLIEHGKRLGAQRAFNDGFAAAQGDYIVVMNDDARLVGDTLVRAYDYLNATPACGQVSFQNLSKTRAAYDGWEGYPYGQCCMTRAWLVHMAGGWGLDRENGGYYFYAGDTQMGCRVWELGYSVDRVPQCGVEDDVLKDETRATAETHPDTAIFKLAWTKRLPPRDQWRAAPDRWHLLSKAVRKELYTIRFKIVPRGAAPRKGMIDAFAKLGRAIQYDYADMDDERVFNLLRQEQPDLVLFQEQGQGALSPRLLPRLRDVCSATTFLNFNGDMRLPVQHEAVAFADACDAALVVSPDLFHFYKHPIFWTKTYEPEFVAVKRAKTPCQTIVFLGNLNTTYPGAAERLDLFSALRGAGLPLEIHGRNFDQALPPTDENHAQNADLYAGAALAISISNFNNLYGYSSDRLYFCLASGAPTLIKRFPGCVAHGLQDGVNCILFDTPGEAIEKASYYLEHVKEREAIGRAARKLVTTVHNWDERVASLLQMLQANTPVGDAGTQAYIAHHGLGKRGQYEYAQAARPTRVIAMPTGLETLTYVGSSSLKMPFYGEVTKTRYYASTFQSQIFVDARDVPSLLAMHDGGKAVFIK